MDYIEIVHEPNYDKQLEELRKRFSRIDEFEWCATWQVGRNYKLFPIAFSIESIHIHIWRSDEADLPDLPMIEIAYSYGLSDGLIHFLGIRSVPSESE
jgi:hypothetical protein